MWGNPKFYFKRERLAGISEGKCPFWVYSIFHGMRESYEMKKRKGYLFTDKKHSNRAVMAVILGVISLISLGAVVFLSYRTKGEIKGSYGVTALLAVIYSVTGLLLGYVTLQNKSYYRLFPVLAVLLNALALFGLGFILYMGV